MTSTQRLGKAAASTLAGGSGATLCVGPAARRSIG